jgi:hypothetical protein
MAFQTADNLKGFFIFVEFIPQFSSPDTYLPAFFIKRQNWQAIFTVSKVETMYRQNYSLLTKNNVMGGLLYLIAVILIIGWLLGVFVYSVGGLIHVLIVLAVIALILGIIRRA